MRYYITFLIFSFQQAVDLSDSFTKLDGIMNKLKEMELNQLNKLKEVESNQLNKLKEMEFNQLAYFNKLDQVKE